MASTAPNSSSVTVLSPYGPPGYYLKNANVIVGILRSRGLALGSPLRAWWILGYIKRIVPRNPTSPDHYDVNNFADDDDHNPNKTNQPPQRRFERDISALWKLIVESDKGKTIEGRDALAHILEALRALRYHHRGWGLDSALLFPTSGQQNPGRPWYDKAVAWDDLPGPSMGFPSMTDAALEELVRPPERSLRAAQRLHEGLLEERKLWTKYHAYLGFVVEDAGKKGQSFTAVPVPEENSLWHSLSYHLSPHTKDGFPNMMRHYEIKACIWAYFAQVLEHPKHVRWREYIYLNYYAVPDNTPPDRVYTPSTILRHLHCNEPIHSALIPALWASPVPNPPTNILHIIADYYAIQIILFTYNSATEGYIAPDHPHTAFHHTVQIYGDPSTPPDRKRQILLFTTDLTPGHFSPVRTDADQPFKPHPNITSYPRMAPWWQSPPHPPPLPLPPCEIPHFALPGSPDVDPHAALWVPNQGTALTTHVVELFRHGRDIQGRSLADLPSRKTVEAWDGPVEPLRYRVVRRKRKQIRYGGLTSVGVTPARDAVPGGSVFAYWHRQVRREGGLEYRGQ